jgi:hypothetical protein
VSLSWTAPTGVIAQAPISDYTVQFKTAAAADWGTFSRAASTATNAVVTGLVNGTAYVFRVSAVNAVGSGTPTAATGAVTPVAVTPDQFFENVAMLLRMDGSGNIFADSSPRPKDIFANGNATQSAAQSKWGGKSALFGGGGDYLSLANYADLNFSTGAFTIECWVRIASFADALTIYAKCQPGNHSLREMAVQIIDANTLRLYHGQRGSNETIRNFTTPTALTTGAWHHVAFTRDDAFLCRAFVDGVASASTHTDIANLDNSFPAFVGAFVLGSDVYGPFLGNIDSLRITKGIARTITLPTVEFPDFGPMSAPTSLAATSGNAQLALTWTAPSYNGGSAITGYTVEYTPSGGSAQTVSTGSTGTSYTLTGLTNGTAYTARVAAVNSVGTGTYTAASSSVTPSAALFSATAAGWSGVGTVGSKLVAPSSPKDFLGATVGDASFTAGVTGTVRVTGTHHDGNDGDECRVSKNGTVVYAVTSGTADVSIAVVAGDVIRVFGTGGGKWFPTTRVWLVP